MRKPIVAGVLLVLSVSAALAQNPAATPSVDLDKMYPAALRHNLIAARDAALASDYAWRQLAYLTENIGPRLTASPQAEAAVQHVAEELRGLGLEVKLEPVQVPHWVRGAETAELVAWPGQPAGTRQKIVVTALYGGSASPVEGITADVVVVNSFEELKQLGRDRIAGRIVLFNKKFDVRKAQAGRWSDAYSEAVKYRVSGGKEAAALGAAGSLVRSVGGDDFRLPHTGWSQDASIPSGAVTAEDADLIAHLASQGRVCLHLTLTPQRLPDVTSYNVVADLRGSEHPEQVVIVSGHLDSWDLGTGALDDGAGVAVAMEAAHILRQLHLRPRRTVRVVAWMNEESGLRGGDAYALDHARELANHIAAIESDLGAGHPLGFHTDMPAADKDWLSPVQETLQATGANVIELTHDAAGADISPMARQGVPTFGLLQDGRVYFNYHHTPADTLDKVNPHELQENAAAMTVLALALADMTEPLPR
jgi:hypothetical protein